MKSMRFAVSMFLVICFVAPLASGATIYVPGDYALIQDAVDAAISGDTIDIAAGSYREDIVITKNLSLVGAGVGQTTILSPTTIGTPWYSKNAVILVHSTGLVSISQMTIDGDYLGDVISGFIGIYAQNAGLSLNKCNIVNFRSDPYTASQSGAGVYVQSNDNANRNIDIMDVTVGEYQKSAICIYARGSMATLTRVDVSAAGAAAPSVQNGIEIGSEGDAVLVDCTVTGHVFLNEALPWTSCGILCYYGGVIDITDCVLDGNQTSISSLDTDGTISGCTITGIDDPQSYHGITAGSPLAMKDAKLPVVVAPPLPFCEEVEPPKGEEKPWDNIRILDCDLTGFGHEGTFGVIVTSRYNIGAASYVIDDCDITGWDCGILGYEDGFSQFGQVQHNRIYDNVTRGADCMGTTDMDARYNWWGHPSGPGGVGPGAGDEVSTFVLYDPWLGPGAIELDPDVTGPIPCGATVTIDFIYTPDGMTEAMRGFNFDIAATAELAFDYTSVTDSGALAALGDNYFQAIDNPDGSVTVAGALLGTTSGIVAETTLFSVTFTAVAEGDAEVTVPDIVLRDLVNGDIVAIGDMDFSINVDCTAPDAVTNLSAEPGHEKVFVRWTDPVGASTIEIWRGLWHDGAGATVYPEYDDIPNTIPTRPATRAAAIASGEWELAGTIAAGTELLVDSAMTERGVYYYEAFAGDLAGNWGPPTVDNVRSLNYWLGDVFVAFDGFVDVADLSVFGSAFGRNSLDPLWNPHVDFGPTDDYSAWGIPATDNVIDFEDLLIIALNFGIVGPTKTDDVGHAPLVLTWTDLGNGEWALALAEPCPRLKGLRAYGELPDGARAMTVAGSLLDQQGAPTLVRDIGRDHLDVCLAVFGAGRGFSGTGELFRLTLPAGISPATFTLVARDIGNADLRPNVQADDGTAPQAFRLDGNFPNPFNPSTTIRYSLPADAQVELSIFNIDGSRVRTLVSGTMAAGVHEIVWNGRDNHGRKVSSGQYFYRIKAGTHCETGKMVLMK